MQKPFFFLIRAHSTGSIYAQVKTDLQFKLRLDCDRIYKRFTFVRLIQMSAEVRFQSPVSFHVYDTQTRKNTKYTNSVLILKGTNEAIFSYFNLLLGNNEGRNL